MGYTPSEYQVKIFEYFTTHQHANMLVEALAGSGKTSTILMLTEQTRTSDVYVAFNKSIQMEMKEKLKNPKTKCYTLHGLALSVMNYNLSEETKKFNLNNLKVYEYVKDLFESDYANLKNKKKWEFQTYLADNYVALYNLVRLKCVDINAQNIGWIMNELGLFPTTPDFSAPDIKEIVQWLSEIERRSNEDFINNSVGDFTDMLYITYKKLKDGTWKVPYWNLYTNIYVDECQDLSQIQLRLLKFFKRSGGRYIFVGDQNQAIYAFAGADCHSIDNIKNNFSPIREFQLPINYRCGRKILDYVNNQFNIGIQARSEANSGHIACIEVGEIKDCAEVGDFIISRYNHQLIQVALDLIKSGKKIFMEDKEVISGLIKFIKSLKVNTIQELKDKCSELKSGTREDGKQLDVDEVQKISMVLILIETYISLAGSTKKDDFIDAFIEYINTLINTTDPSDTIRLMSIHKSKGLESNNVFILNNARPQYKLARSQDMMQQEENLSYVALTRPKDVLYLVRNGGNSDEANYEEIEEDDEDRNCF